MWLGLLGCDTPAEHLDRALELDAGCEPARQTLVQWILASVEYNQHELPNFYIHDPQVDLPELRRALELSDGSDDQDWAMNTRREVSELRTRAEDWLANHPREGDFAVH